SFYVWQTIWLTAAFLAGLLLFWIVPALSRLRPATVRDLLASAGVGLLALVGLPVVALIAAVTLIGLPLGLIALACWLIAMYFAKIVVAGFLGRSLLEKNDTHASTALVLLAGLVPIFIAINLPYVGGLVNFLLIVLGLGMLVLRAFQTTGSRSIQAASRRSARNSSSAARRPVAIAPCIVPELPSLFVASPAKKSVSAMGRANAIDAVIPPTGT